MLAKIFTTDMNKTNFGWGGTHIFNGTHLDLTLALLLLSDLIAEIYPVAALPRSGVAHSYQWQLTFMAQFI